MDEQSLDQPGHRLDSSIGLDTLSRRRPVKVEGQHVQ